MQARTICWLACIWVVASGNTAFAQRKAADVLADFKPIIPGVEYDTPTDPAELAACKLEVLPKDAGWEVKDSQGKLLRRFVDTNRKVTKRDKEKQESTHVDQWSYYKDGFEVYREVDADEDGSLDEVRWLNQGGTRVGVVRGNRIAAWRRLSPEEATKVYVTALVAGDARLLETVIATPDELKSLNLPDAAVQEAAVAAAARAKNPGAALKLPKGWDAQTVWSRFDGWLPHTIPGDPAAGNNQEVVLYENGVVFAAPATLQGEPPAMAYLHVPELVRIGETWKFFRLPRSVDPADPVVANIEDGSLRSLMFGPQRPAENPDEAALIALSKSLSEYDARMPAADDARAMTAWHIERMRIIDQQGIKKVSTQDNKDNLYKQAIHDLAEAHRRGLFPDGEKIFKNFIAIGGRVGAFAAYRLILAEFDLAASQPNVKMELLQAETLKKLERWLVDYPNAEEVPEVLLQIGSAYDLDNEEDKARVYYQRLATEFADTEPGKKGAGALRRNGAVGKPLALSGPTFNGKTINTSSYAGKNVLVVFWMSGPEPDRRELADLQTVVSRLKEKVEIVTVNLDLDKKELEDYLRANNLGWPIVYEPGGLDSRLGVEWGIIATPTMFLVDAQGKVVSTRIRKATEIQRLLEKPLAAGKADLELKLDR